MRIKKFILLMTVFSLLFLNFQFIVKSAEKGAQRKVLMELFTATWCGPCAAYGHYADETYDYFGADKVVLLRNQVWNDGLDTPETNARCSFYGVEGVPTLYINGQYKYHPMNYNDYRTKISDILNKPAQALISINPQCSLGSQFINLKVEVKLIENIDLGNLNLIVALYEKQVNYTGSNKIPLHKFVIRDYIFDEIGSKLVFTDRVAKIDLPIFLKKGVKAENFGIAAWIQNMKTLEVIQVESSEIKKVSNPAAPVLLFPKNGDLVKETPIFVKWIGDGDIYVVQISDKEDFSKLIIDTETSQTELLVDNLDSETKYFLRIKSVKGSLESVFSSIVSFSITNKSKLEWQFKSLNVENLSGGTINAFVQNPTNSNILYVGTQGGGVFKSIDGGKTWVAKNLGLDDLYVQGLDIDPTNSSKLFAATTGGLFISENGGNFWVYYGLSGCKSVKYVPKTNNLFVLTSEGLLRSSDTGNSFSTIIPKSLINYRLIQFSVNKNNDLDIYLAGYSYDSSSYFIYKTTDGGKNWSQIDLGFLQNSPLYDISIDYNNPLIIYIASVDFYKSVDGGITFFKVLTPNNYIYSIAVDETIPGRIAIISRYLYVYISEDFGNKWNSITPNLKVGSPYKLFFDISNNYKLYLCSLSGGLYLSTDSGKNFTAINKGVYAVNVAKVIKTQDITALTSSGVLVFLGSGWQTLSNYSFSSSDNIKQNDQNSREIIVASPVYWSQDGGKTWEYHNINNGLYSYTFDVYFKEKTLFFIYRSSSKWYLGKADFYGNLKESYEIGAQNINWINQILVDQANPMNIFLAVGLTWNSSAKKYEGYGILKSADGGKTFQEFAFKEDGVSKIFIDSYNQSVLFANTWSGLYKSVDKGLNWKKVLSLDTSVLRFAPDNKTIYAASGKNLLISEDYGDSWTFVPWDYSISFSKPTIKDIFIDKDNPTNIYIATDGSGIYKYFVPSSKTFTIRSSAGPNGTISPLGSISASADDFIAFTITPNTGFKIKDVKVDGASVGAVSIYTFSNLTSDHTIEAAFEPITYTITAFSSIGGTISPSGTITVNYGDTKTFTITPNTGFKISNVIVDRSVIGPVSSYTFSNIVSNHTIEATFEKLITQTVIVFQIGSPVFTVNGSLRTLDSPPIIKNNRTLLPIRAVVEALNGTVSWDASSMKVTVSLGSRTLELWIGKSTAKVNGIDAPIDSTNPKVVPEIINGRTMLPLRFVAENLGFEVEWEGTTKTITITYKGG